MKWVSFIKNKLKALEKFRIFKALVENRTRCKLKCIRSDRGGEFIDYEFANLCNEYGIKQQFTIAGTPQQNGVAERQNRSVQKIARALCKRIIFLKPSGQKQYTQQCISLIMLT